MPDQNELRRRVAQREQSDASMWRFVQSPSPRRLRDDEAQAIAQLTFDRYVAENRGKFASHVAGVDRSEHVLHEAAAFRATCRLDELEPQTWCIDVAKVAPHTMTVKLHPKGRRAAEVET